MDQEKIESNSIEQKLDIITIYKFFVAQKKLIIFITGGFILIGILYALLITPWYRTKVKIMPTSGQESSIISRYSNIAALAGLNIGSESGDNYDLYPEIVKSNFVLDRVLKHKYQNSIFNKPVTLFEFWNTEIDSSKPNWKHKLFEDAKVKLRKDYINASIDKINNLLTIQVAVPKDPVLAANLANYITELLDIYNKNFRHYKAKDQRKFIEKSLKETEQNLKNAENNLKTFLSENKDISSPEKKLKYESLKSELDLQRTLYVELKKQLELTKIAEVKETETINILDKAVIPVRRYKPQRSLIVIVFSIIGFILAILFIILKHYYYSFKMALNKKS